MSDSHRFLPQTQWPSPVAEDWPKMDFVSMHTRGERGWCPSDIWSMDTYISGVIAGMLRQMIADDTGYPTNSDPETWTAILTEMAEGFEAWAGKFIDLEHENEAYKKVQKSLRLMHRWFGALWT